MTVAYKKPKRLKQKEDIETCDLNHCHILCLFFILGHKGSHTFSYRFVIIIKPFPFPLIQPTVRKGTVALLTTFYLHLHLEM